VVAQLLTGDPSANVYCLRQTRSLGSGARSVGRSTAVIRWRAATATAAAVGDCITRIKLETNCPQQNRNGTPSAQLAELSG
jgi:hypothetical protein